MKKSAIILLILCIVVTACSVPEKDGSALESIPETAAAAIAAETIFSETDETSLETKVSESAVTSAMEVIKIKREDISDEFIYDGETQTIGDDLNGYLEIPAEWEYEKPDDYYNDAPETKGVEFYTDNGDNRIFIRNCSLTGFGIIHKDIDELAGLYDYSGSFNDFETVKYEVDGYTAYKITHSGLKSELKAVLDEDHDNEYYVCWLFECEDEVNREVKFIGSEDFIKMSDNIIKTYHLYN